MIYSLNKRFFFHYMLTTQYNRKYKDSELKITPKDTILIKRYRQSYRMRVEHVAKDSKCTFHKVNNSDVSLIIM